MRLQAGLLAVGAGWLGMAGLCGCHSAYVEADVKNATSAAVSLVEVDYPSASFGKEALPAGATYHYRFKILGSGETKVTWTDAAQKEHTVKGPQLHEGQEGSMNITIGDDTVHWGTMLHP